MKSYFKKPLTAVRVRHVVAAHGMKSYFKKLLTAVLSAAIVFSATSCGKTNDTGKGAKSGVKIPADMPWYEAKEYQVDLGLDKNREVEFSYPEFVGGDDKYVFVKTSAVYKHPGSQYGGPEDQAELITMADRDTGETVKVIDLLKFLPEGYWPSCAHYRNKILELTVSAYSEDAMKYVTKQLKVDPVEETIIEEREEEDEYFQNTSYDFGDYHIDVIALWTEDGNNWFQVNIRYKDGSTKSVEIKEEGQPLYAEPVFLPMNKTQLLVYTMTERDKLFYKLDLESCYVTKQDPNDYDWLDMERIYNVFNGSDGYAYYTEGTGIYRFDMDKKCVEEALNYSWCDTNRSRIINLDLGDISNDSILLCSQTSNQGLFDYFSNDAPKSFTFVSLTKTRNPHAGKQILEMYVPYGMVSDAIYDKIVEFNNTNGKYFIEITDRYTKEYDIGYVENEDDESLAVINGTSKMGNKIAMDIMSGNGPDILFDAYYLGPINYKENLADLTPYIGTLDKDKYFTNIVDISKKDGRIYEMPLAVGAYGIETDAKYAGKTGQGFTTDEYLKFLKETLNGEDIIRDSQPYYFVELFNSMKGSFIKDGKADFTGEDFAKLAEFVKNNVSSGILPEEALISDEYSDQGIDDWYSLTPAICASAADYWVYFSNLERTIGDGVMLGMPSSDGRGPVAIKGLSIAVSAHAVDVDACGEFVKMLLADDVQYKLALEDYLPLDREAFRKAGLEAVDFFNSVSVNEFYNPDGSTARNRITFTEDHINKLENTILSCTEMSSEDPDIEKILVEEMPAYFSGQKDLSEVVKIAQDRVQKVLGERG